MPWASSHEPRGSVYEPNNGAWSATTCAMDRVSMEAAAVDAAAAVWKAAGQPYRHLTRQALKAAGKTEAMAAVATVTAPATADPDVCWTCWPPSSATSSPNGRVGILQARWIGPRCYVRRHPIGSPGHWRLIGTGRPGPAKISRTYRIGACPSVT